MTRALTAAETRVGSDLNAWLKAGGGAGLTQALQDPAAIIPTLEAADLRGQGGAGFPTHRKWTLVAEQSTTPGHKWIVCNGNEDEPGTFKDRFLLTETPHQVIEGALIAALAVGAGRVVLYTNPHETAAISALQDAALAWKASPLITEVSDRVGTQVAISIVTSSGLYIGGEETAAIASIMGGFPFPALKPPFPAEKGVFDRPTLLNNVETFAHVTHIMARGASWYRSLGIGAAAGMKLYSLSGDVMRPGLYEMPMGTSLRKLIDECGGGMLAEQPFKAVFTGGPSNTLLTATDLDVALDFDSLRAKGSRLGTGAMIVVGAKTSILRKTSEYIGFFAASSCGQCPPCKIGTHQIARILQRIEKGTGRPGDLSALENLASMLPGSGRCGLVDGAATVLASSLNSFRSEYERAMAE